MLRLVIAAVAVLFAGVLAIASTLFTVPPDRVGVIIRSGEPVRLAQPGLRWRIPLIENVAEIRTSRLHRQSTDLTVLLADDSDCRVSAIIETRVDDPMRAYRWRTARGLSGGDADALDAASEYTAWSAAFAAALRDATRSMTPDAAAGGAIKTWFSKFNADGLEDGTTIIAATVDAATCWDAATERPSAMVGERAPPSYGALKRFVRSAVRPVIPEDASSEVIALPPEIAIDRMGRRLQIEGVTAQVRVADRGRVEALFGSGPAGLSNAAARAEAHVAAALRRAISELDETGLERFDPYVVVEPGSELAGRLAGEGLTIDDFAGEMMGYRPALP